MYARTFRIAQGKLRPVLVSAILIGGIDPKDATGMLNAKFYLQPINDDGTLGTIKINGAAAAIVTLNPLVLSYAWAGSDTDTLGLYASWFDGFYGPGNTDAEQFEGPEIKIYANGTRLVW